MYSEIKLKQKIKKTSISKKKKTKLKLMLAKKFGNYRLTMAGLTQNKQKYFTSLKSLKTGKMLIILDQKEEKLNIKK